MCEEAACHLIASWVGSIVTRKTSIAIVVLGCVSAADADLALCEDWSVFGGRPSLWSDNDGAYTCWLEIADPSIVEFAGDPVFTPAGNPSGSSTATYWPEYGAWYEITVASLDPSRPILAGKHVIINLRYVGPTTWPYRTSLNLYAEDGGILLGSLEVVPEPATSVLLGLGGLVLLRKRNSADKS
ncbi:MAG: PEP-CTERM sorting domain-containing protein [Phycisphaerales bacterium]|nr:MAG: PEP-CTERM sorting domain-containing protein [Phycisphaerales bacterium]